MTADDLDDINDGRQIASTTVGVVLRYVRRLAGSEQADRVLELAGLDPEDPRLDEHSGWVTYREAVRVFDAAAAVIGEPAVARRAGEELLRQYAGSEVAALLRSLGSPEAVIASVTVATAKFSTVTTATTVAHAGEDGSAMVEARAVPPFERSEHLCQYMAGVLSQSTALFGLPPAPVEEIECQRRGDDRCLYRVELAPVDEGDPQQQIARLEQDLAMLEARFESLRSTATELVSARTVEQVLATVTRRAMEAVRAPQFLLAVRLQPEAPLRIHHEGFRSDAAAREHAEAHLAGAVPTDGPLLAVDVATSFHRFGVLAATYPGAGGFLPQEEHLLAAYASHAAAALEVAASIEEVHRKNVAARALLDLASTLARAHTQQDIADALLRAVPGIVGSTVVTVLLREDESAPLRFVGVDGVPPNVAAALSQLTVEPLDSATLQAIYRDPRPTVLTSLDDDPYVLGLFDLVGNARAVVVPIVVQDVVLGVIGTDLADEAPLDEVLERLEGLADQASTALLNVRLLETVRDQALHDALTGLPNARFVRERLTDAVRRAAADVRLAVLFIDLDEFKPVNDRFGHAVGDEVLRICADRLRGHLRAGDVIARLGGDEFVALLTEVDQPEDALATARRLHRSLVEPVAVDGDVLQLSCSIGIALFPDHGEHFDELLRRADAAMYQTKQSRRGGSAMAAHAPEPR